MKLNFALYGLFRNEIFSHMKIHMNVGLTEVKNSQNAQLVDISKGLFCVV